MKTNTKSLIEQASHASLRARLSQRAATGYAGNAPWRRANLAALDAPRPQHAAISIGH